jgi:uncharacterized protein YjbI with pentapeptide repeats
VNTVKRVKRWFRRVEWITPSKAGLVLAGIATLVLVLGSIAAHGLFLPYTLFLDLWSNIGTELAGIVITVLIIDRLNNRRSKRQEKEALILQMGSPSNIVAVEAARILRLHEWGWNEDRSLTGKLFPFADLTGASLSWCNLSEARLDHALLSQADLRYANLRGAGLSKANLESVFFLGANLENADLRGANLTKASFGSYVPEGVNFTLLSFLDKVGRKNLDKDRPDKVNLRNANFSDADLQNTDFMSADLTGANLAGANLTGAKKGSFHLLPVEKLAAVDKLYHATMPNGYIYDGRLNLKGDMEFAQRAGKDTNDAQTMADWYDVSLEIYLNGQKWAEANLAKLKDLVD